MKQSQKPKISLYHQILLLTLTPIFILSIVLTHFYLHEHSNDSKAASFKLGLTVSSIVAQSSQEAIEQKSIAQLNKLSISTLSIDSIKDVIFLDNQYNIIHRSFRFPIDIQPTASTPYCHNHQCYFVRNISKSNKTSALFKQDINIQVPKEIIGWVVVIIKEQTHSQHNQQIIFSIIGLILFILAMAYIFARSIAKKIITPLLDIIAVVEAFQKGNFATRVQENNAGNLRKLAVGINKMAVTIQDSTTQMKTRVASATRRLQSAMYHLEQQNDELRIAKQKEVAANQAKDQFLARMSHELRTPLTSVLGFAKILHDTKRTTDQIEPIRIINHTSQLLLSLIDNILDYSKLQNNAISLEQLDFDPETAILDILEMQSPMAHSKGVELSLLNKNECSYIIKGDPTRFKQIISNLVSNAIKFTDTGSVAVTIEIKTVSSQYSNIMISVTDTGIGISEDQLKILFQAFVQADTSITRRFGGSGLGLVITQTLIKLMGGKLDIYSKEGKGTNVTLQIPTLISSQVAIPNEPLNNNETILVYDKFAHTRRAITLILKRQHKNYRSISSIEELIDNIALYQHIIIGVGADDEENALVKKIIPLITENNSAVIFALPNAYTLPKLAKCVSIINKPIRPETMILATHSHLAPYLTPSDYSTKKAIKVVVAEDNAFNQILIAKILEKHKIQPFIASNGKEAIELIDQHQPDLVILDIHMPVMDGFEATRIIRQKSDIPIISLTANIIEQDHHKVTLAGSNCIVLKPINDVELITQILRLVHAKEAEHEADSSDTNTRSLLTSQVKPEIDQPEHSDSGTNISDYDLDVSILKDELFRLCSLIKQGFIKVDYEDMRNYAHQLIGLAGLYELPDIEITTIALQEALKDENLRTTWLYLHRLQRTIITCDEEA
ncbi:ATP-binding protein [Gammaproteobacteria bacterium AS21]